MNPDVISPNMDRLAAEGVILDRNYAQPICSPSRAALMSGVYPYKMGRQVCFRNTKYLSVKFEIKESLFYILPYLERFLKIDFQIRSE